MSMTECVVQLLFYTPWLCSFEICDTIVQLRNVNLFLWLVWLWWLEWINLLRPWHKTTLL